MNYFIPVGDVGTPTRTRKLFELPGTNLTPPKTPDNNLIERKLKEIMAMSGTLTLNGNVIYPYFPRIFSG